MTFHMDNSGPWSVGVYLGIPGAILSAALFIGLTFLMRHWWKTADNYDRGMARFLTYAAGVFTVVTVMVGIAAFYPFGGEYHQFRNVSGTVEQIDNRLIGNGSGGMEDKFVVRFKGSTLQFGCDDTRCASVREGDSLVLSCKREWQYTGTDGYNCRFVSMEKG